VSIFLARVTGTTVVSRWSQQHVTQSHETLNFPEFYIRAKILHVKNYYKTWRICLQRNFERNIFRTLKMGLTKSEAFTILELPFGLYFLFLTICSNVLNLFSSRSKHLLKCKLYFAINSSPGS